MIEGALIGDSFAGPGFAVSFVLRHSRVLSPGRFAGRYRFEISRSPRGSGQPSVLNLGLEVAEDGTAVSSEAIDVGDGDVAFGAVTTGECRVAPNGHFHCGTLYLIAESVLSMPLRFTGALPNDGPAVAGSGHFLSGVDPPFGPEPYVGGQWTARRVSDDRLDADPMSRRP